MYTKQFVFTAKGFSFDLNTFETTEKVFYTQTNTINFKSKADFIQCIDKAIDDFYKGYNALLEEGTPSLQVDYKGYTHDLCHVDLSGSSYIVNSNRSTTRCDIMELVRLTETKLKKPVKRSEPYIPIQLQR